MNATRIYGTEQGVGLESSCYIDGVPVPYKKSMLALRNTEKIEKRTATVEGEGRSGGSWALSLRQKGKRAEDQARSLHLKFSTHTCRRHGRSAETGGEKIIKKSKEGGAYPTLISCLPHRMKVKKKKPHKEGRVRKLDPSMENRFSYGH